MSIVLKAGHSAYIQAAASLKSGGLVVLPTETVYGVAGLASDPAVIHRIYALKSRPKSKALSAVVFSRAQAEKIGQFSLTARRLADAFWPGPLTLVVPLRKGAPIDKSALAGNTTIGLRFPDIEWVKGFKQSGFTAPLVLPSANLSGQPAPTSATTVSSDIKDEVDLIVDSGQCNTGIESTIISVDKSGAKLLRLGAIAPEKLAPFSIDGSGV